MRIISRQNEDQIQHDRLREILEAATDGNITPADNLPELVTQIEDAVLNCMDYSEKLSDAYGNLRLDAAGLEAQCTMQEQKLEEIQHVGFDEALDYATLDLMDAFLGSGAANASFSGDLSFDPCVMLTKQDLKPLLRQAIITWVNNKVS